MSPQISIITVVRNADKALKKTIESIREQSYSNIEYVVVDGDSTDNTLNIINENKDIINTWISESDKGLYFAMNKGLGLAKGDFVFFMNAGDIFTSKNVIQNITKSINDLDAVYFGYVQICSGNVYWETKPSNNNNHIQKGDTFLPHHQSIFYPKKYYQSTNYDTQFAIVGDIDFTLRACLKYPKYYIDVNTIQSQLEGFGIMAYSDLKRTLSYSGETKQLYNRYPNFYSNFEKLMILPKYLFKFLMYHIGGLKLVNIALKYYHK